MSDALTIAFNVNAEVKAPSQYINMPFESVVEFNGKTLFLGDSGIFEEGGGTDNDTDIDAWIDTPNHDFGKREQKSIEAFDVGYETAGDLFITLFGDEHVANARTYTLEQVKSGQVQQDEMQTLKKYKYGKARYWKVRLGNIDGCDFSIDYLALAPVFLKRRSRR